MRIIAKLLALVLCVVSIAAPVSASEETADRLRVVSTIFAPYDFMRQIAGENAQVEMLLAPGAESHSYEPTPQDIIKIAECDVFVYPGSEHDVWVDRILESVPMDNKIIIKLVDLVETVDEELVEGMEDSHGHEEESFDPEKVYARDLMEWSGSWKSLALNLEDGSLTEYVQSKANTGEASFDETLEDLKTKWATDDFDVFMIAGDRVYLDKGDTTCTGAYRAEGYAIVERDDGSASVWYQYALTDDSEGMPKYIILNDHGTGTPPEAEDEHAEDAKHHEEEEAHDEHSHDHGVAHTHIRYSDISFEDAIAVEGWNPFFVDAGASNEKILATLSGHSHDHTHLDEHVWTSPKNAMLIVEAFAKTLASLDSANASTYESNAQTYLQQLQELDQAFMDVVANGSRNLIIFGDRFPFRYLADAYGLSYYAAFTGCSTETDASAKTIAFLTDKIEEEQIPVVFTIELSNGRIADVLTEGTDAKRLEMHAAHNVTKDDFENGVTYLDLMQRNVEALKEALQ